MPYKDKAKHKECQRRWKEKNKEKVKQSHRLRHVRVEYGLSEAEYKLLIDIHNNCCAGCGVNFSDAEIHVCVDHCHRTGKVRGLLCRSCNFAIGLIKENINTLNTLANYLKRHET